MKMLVCICICICIWVFIFGPLHHLTEEPAGSWLRFGLIVTLTFHFLSFGFDSYLQIRSKRGGRVAIRVFNHTLTSWDWFLGKLCTGCFRSRAAPQERSLGTCSCLDSLRSLTMVGPFLNKLYNILNTNRYPPITIALAKKYLVHFLSTWNGLAKNCLSLDTGSSTSHNTQGSLFGDWLYIYWRVYCVDTFI